VEEIAPVTANAPEFTAASVEVPDADSVVNAPDDAVEAPIVPLIFIEAVPVRFVTTPLAGVPSAGVTRVGDVDKTTLPEPVEVVTPVPPRNTVSVPVVPATIGSPVALVSVAEDGVPSAGVTRVGDVANTLAPDPVSLVSAAANCAEVNEPSDVALPTLVTAPVRFALVVTLPAVRPAAVPVMFVPTKADGVPSAGVTNVGDVDITTLPVPVMALDTKFLDASVNTATDAVKSVT